MTAFDLQQNPASPWRSGTVPNKNDRAFHDVAADRTYYVRPTGKEGHILSPATEGGSHYGEDSKAPPSYAPQTRRERPPEALACAEVLCEPGYA